MEIVITDGYALNPGDLSWDALQQMGHVTLYDRTSDEQIVERCQHATIVLTNKVPFRADVLERLSQLKYIGVTATGYNIIDVAKARERGILVSNIPAYSTSSVAQHVFALLLSITNRIEHYTSQITTHKRWSQQPDFCYWDTNLIELTGKRIGIYGVGRIGTQVAHIAQALGMEVLACTRKSQTELPEGITKVAEEEFWGACDIISLHAPLSPATYHLVNADTLARMKKGCILLNTSRGDLVDEAAVAQALQEHRLQAYAADVMSQEPPAADNPLLHAPNVFLTPHIAWATKEARQRLMSILVENVASYLQGHPLNVVN